MFERARAYAARIGAARARRRRDRILSEFTPPPGVHVDAGEGEIILSGRRLRRRFIEDSRLRNFPR